MGLTSRSRRHRMDAHAPDFPHRNFFDFVVDHHEGVEHTLPPMKTTLADTLVQYSKIEVPNGVIKYSTMATRYAAARGDMPLLEWLGTHLCCAWDEGVCAMAAKHGHLHVVKWLREEKMCAWDENTCVYAALGGHLGVLEWALRNGCPSSPTAFDFAALNGHLGAMKLLYSPDIGVEMREMAALYAARAGHTDIIEWLYVSGFSAATFNTLGLCNEAAEGGHLDTVIWLWGVGVTWDSNTCTAAAKNGHLDVLKWLRHHGCLWDADTTFYAAHGEHVETLRWCMEQGCPWRTDTIILYHNTDVLEYLKFNNIKFVFRGRRQNI